MSRRPAAILALVVLGALACGNRERAPHDFERMRLQQRYDPYAPSGVFADGKAMQAPPQGTVAREAVVDAGAVDAAGHPVERMPLAVTPELLAEGRERFGIYCAACHGTAGFGGSVVAADMGPPRPPSLRTARVRQLNDGAIYRLIALGGTRMPSYAWQLSERQRWAVVAYVRALERTPAAADPAAVEDSLAAERLQRIDATGGR